MATGVEWENQVVHENVSTGKFVSEEPSAVVDHTQGMHVDVKSFMETYFASCLLIGEPDMEGLCQLCHDPDAEGNNPEGVSSETGPSSNPYAYSLLILGGLCGPLRVRILLKG
ncbi:unnamed protein product [Lactuca virosa]|uniref:Uncharacterized protein n=1 Tax=Lactuca virosa TaxID=75947 RepID=A0AAU9NAV5_9ASTR|nr:unnamed protein product [Lactuca virosa]